MNDTELYNEMLSRQRRSHPFYYMAFNADNSRRLREMHSKNIPPLDNQKPIYTKQGTLIANGFRRIVIGDYGAYVEFDTSQANSQIFRRWFKNLPNKHSKYDWFYPSGEIAVKVYFQLKTVSYADYRVGYYYIGVGEVAQ